MRRLVSRFIHQWKKQLRQDGVSEDDLLEIKQDISSLRYELREDRKREELQTAISNETLKRDLMRFISTTSAGGGASGAGGGAVGGSGRNLVAYQPLPSSRQSSVDRPDISAAVRNEYLGGGNLMSADEMNTLKKEIVSSLRIELRELVREIALATVAGARMVTRESPVIPSPSSSLIPTHGSDLYQTHLYTQL